MLDSTLATNSGDLTISSTLVGKAFPAPAPEPYVYVLKTPLRMALKVMGVNALSIRFRDV